MTEVKIQFTWSVLASARSTLSCGNAVGQGSSDLSMPVFRPSAYIQSVTFRIICRSVSELFVVKSLHARAERNVGSSSKCCDGSISDDPAISGTKEISGDGRGRRGHLLSNRSKMGKSVSEAWAGSSCTQVKRRPRRAKGSLTEDQGRVQGQRISVHAPEHLQEVGTICVPDYVDRNRICVKAVLVIF